MKTLTIPFPEKLFLSHVDKQEEHWLWTGATGGSSNTYGVFTVVFDGERQTKMAHVWSYLFYVGDIPDDYEVDHKCKIRLCVRPQCLEAVTQEENNKRKRREFCRNGHKQTDEVVYWYKGKRNGCRICRYDAVKRSKGR